MSAFAEDQRALVVAEHGDGAAVVFLHGGFVEAEMAEHAAERFREILLGEDFERRTAGEDSAVDEHDLVAKLGHGAEVVGGDEHEVALGAELAEQLDDGRFGLHIDAGEGLVEQDDAPALGERSGEEDALLLPAAQLADLAVAEVEHADAGEAFLDDAAVFGARDAEEIQVAVAAHHDHVPDAHGKAPVHLFALRHVGDEVALLRGSDSPLGNLHAAFARLDKPHDRFEERGFAAAIDADERADGAAVEAKAGVLQRGVAVRVGDGDVADVELDGSVAHSPSRPFTIVSTSCSSSRR